MSTDIVDIKILACIAAIRVEIPTGNSVLLCNKKLNTVI